jgi:hypothetical protein
VEPVVFGIAKELGTGALVRIGYEVFLRHRSSSLDNRWRTVTNPGSS